MLSSSSVWRQSSSRFFDKLLYYQLSPAVLLGVVAVLLLQKPRIKRDKASLKKSKSCFVSSKSVKVPSKPVQKRLARTNRQRSKHFEKRFFVFINRQFNFINLYLRFFKYHCINNSYSLTLILSSIAFVIVIIISFHWMISFLLNI